MDRPSLKMQARRAWRVLGLVFVAQTAAMGLVIGRQAGESQRTHDVVRKGVQADCRFLRDLADVARLSPTPSRILVQIARDAADGYVGKGCPTAKDPGTGEPFGPPPPIPPPVVTTPPPR